METWYQSFVNVAKVFFDPGIVLLVLIFTALSLFTVWTLDKVGIMSKKTKG